MEKYATEQYLTEMKDEPGHTVYIKSMMLVNVFDKEKVEEDHTVFRKIRLVFLCMNTENEMCFLEIEKDVPELIYLSGAYKCFRSDRLSSNVLFFDCYDQIKSIQRYVTNGIVIGKYGIYRSTVTLDSVKITEDREVDSIGNIIIPTDIYSAFISIVALLDVFSFSTGPTLDVAKITKRFDIFTCNTIGPNSVISTTKSKIYTVDRIDGFSRGSIDERYHFTPTSKGGFLCAGFEAKETLNGLDDADTVKHVFCSNIFPCDIKTVDSSIKHHPLSVTEYQKSFNRIEILTSGVIVHIFDGEKVDPTILCCGMGMDEKNRNLNFYFIDSSVITDVSTIFPLMLYNSNWL